MRTNDNDILHATFDYFVGRIIPCTPTSAKKGSKW